MLKEHRKGIAAGLLLHVAAFGVQTILQSDGVSPCLNQSAAPTMTCGMPPPEMADRPDGGHEPLPLQRLTNIATTTSTSSQFGVLYSTGR